MHLSRLDEQLVRLLRERPVAALACLDDDGAPALSMVPYAVAAEPDEAARLILHVSGLAAHTRQMARDARVSLLILDRDDAAEMPQALQRASLQATAAFVEPGSPAHAHCEALYLARHPQAALMTQLPDFRFVRLQPSLLRHVAGFGAARTLDGELLVTVLRAAG
ncbi:MAG TPA: pyridoxamine 5'-phosphate oxidase family protein [Burkholderiaceae bacterium]|nr:pyridoxamine 5'-phosphate oxidase family protein [Burkholderiaceae bacterium]HMX09591.1 pyridoxamine 5'-phosphate oxidase family protein [Burkholderiaceae bacterium]HMZ01065.1 pyridoxamine 5'-phosphate oxidase family protein [Burkholderiaceae bacterium]HNB45868.1 pyridoxamine 5'-phosphate oxidase family protein [Burkholderiaceae bacterium]HNG78744.1 pyridoxamine 5'-phosphate oxidase family protein [Burkholderiaceae bacterium]